MKQFENMNHFETAERHFKLNQEFSTDLYKTRFYETMGLAIYDISFSLLQFLSHRPKVALIRQGSSVFESMIPIFLRQQTQIQFKTASQNSNQFLEEIDKETNFVLWSAENEVTGEILYSEAQCIEIHKILSAKRIFSIQVTQASRKINKAEVFKNNYAILVESGNLFSSQQVQLFFTDKLKAPTLIGAFQKNDYNHTEKNEFINVELKLLTQYQYESFFQPTVNYLADRKTFIFKNCSGTMLMQKLINHKYIPAEFIFAPSSLPTWVLDTFKNWWPEAEKPNLLLNLVTLSNQAFVQNSKLESQILEIYKSIVTESSWSVG